MKETKIIEIAKTGEFQEVVVYDKNRSFTLQNRSIFPKTGVIQINIDFRYYCSKKTSDDMDANHEIQLQALQLPAHMHTLGVSLIFHAILWVSNPQYDSDRKTLKGLGIEFFFSW